MDAPIFEPMHGRAWRDFFVGVSNAINCDPPNFRTIVNKDTYNSVFQMWCLNVQKIVNDITPGAIDDPPFEEGIIGGRFGKSFTEWFGAVAREV